MKHKKIQFLRFLLERYYQGVHPNYALKRLTVSVNEPLEHIINRWYKEKYHVLEIVDEVGRPISFIPEEEILSQYFQNPYGRLHP
jgi:stage IV sporulation protein FB